MTSTPKIIDDLVERAAPVRRLRPPLMRALLWLGFAAAVCAFLAIWQGARADLALRLKEPVFVLGFAAALATGILAAIAAFAVSLPDRPQWWLLLPTPALALWLTTVGYGCLTDWVSIGRDGWHLGETAHCFAMLGLAGAPLSIALVAMLRYAARLRPGAVAMTGALAVAAISSAALSLLHDHNATMLILIENLGSAVLITGLGSLFGRTLLAWAATFFQPFEAGALARL